MSTWSPAQYEKFKSERSQPFFDLLKLVRGPVGRVVDLGCGTGELTAELHRRTQAASTIGIDSSETMLAKSTSFAVSGLRFQRANIETWQPPTELDLVFSNAALQWVDDHPAILARVASWLAPGGQIAMQIPANQDDASHRVANEVASEQPFRDALGGFTVEFPVLKPEEYARLLERIGFDALHVRLQVYIHHLASREEVAEWVRGTLLTAYFQRLPAAHHEAFFARYRAALRAVLPDEQPFVFTFKRILFHGSV